MDNIDILSGCDDVIYAIAFCILCPSVIFAIVILFRYPRLWLRSLVVLITSVALMIGPRLEVFNTLGGLFAFIVPLQFGFLLILIGSVIGERKHDPK